MRTETGQTVKLEDYRPSPFGITHTDLDIRLDPEATEVTATLTVTRRSGTEGDKPLRLDGDGLELTGLVIDGQQVGEDGYTVTPDRLTITALPDAERFKVTISTRINPAANTQLMGLYRTAANYCTQCEAEGFRRICYFLDRPDILSVYTVRIEGCAAGEPLLLSNGNPVASGPLEGGRHFAVWHDPHPKPSYLFALFAGNLGVVEDGFITASGRQVTLKIFVEHGKEQRALYAMDALKRSMRWDEERFGREYDLDLFMIVAVPDFNMGAMENKGLNIFNDKYVLADPATATDTDYASIEAIIAHEYFHNWTGNRITCRDWFQLCLKEGLTVYRDQEFSADMRSRAVQRIGDVRALRAHQFAEDAGPLAHPVRPESYKEINNFYTATVYEKGAEIVRMLRAVLGADGFAAGIDLYFERHDGDASTIEDFLACFADATGADLTRFARWYSQPGTPNLAISTRYVPAEKRFLVSVRQSLRPPVKGAPHEPVHIPLAFALIGPDGGKLDYRADSNAPISRGKNGDDDVLHITEAQHEIALDDVAERPVLSALRQFSAPVTRVPQPPLNERLFLARNDSDPFARWEALESLLVDELKKAAGQVRAGQGVTVSATLAEVYGAIAANPDLDHALRALCLTLPSEADIAREIGRDIDPDAIHRARQAVLVSLARSSEPVLARVYHEMLPRHAYTPDAAAAGRRALRNVATMMLCMAAGSTDKARAAFEAADNMTDRAHALAVLAQQAPDEPATVAALEAFLSAFRNEPVVLDKWFMIQATVPRAETLMTVEALTRAPGFSWDNPNRVRALIGAFATANPVAFNRIDGKGYRFLAASAARIDAANPQLAARLMTAMGSWRNLEPQRRASAETALSDLARNEAMSKDLRDIVERTLG